MPTFKQKNVIKSYKLRLQEKLKTVTEETENANSFLNNYLEQFRCRVQHILEIKDEKCLSLYRKLIRDLENFSEKLFILQATFEDVSDESGSEDDEDSGTRSQGDQSHPVTSCSSLHNAPFPSSSADKNVVLNKEDACDEGGSVTEDDFYSLHSDSNTQNIPSDTFLINSQADKCHNESVIENNYESTKSFSLSSCYRSLSSNFSESFVPCSENKKTHPSEPYSFNIKYQNSSESKETMLVIHPPNIKVPSKFSTTLLHIIDPGDFWIQIGNSYDSNLNFPKNEYAHLSCPSSMKEGEFFLAPFKSTPFFSRAQSLSSAKFEKDFVKVHFIDHGSIEDVALCDIRPLPSSAYEICAQAIHCYIHGISPINGSWLDDCISTFKDFQNYCIEARIKSEESLYAVQLIAKVSEDLNEDFSIDIALSLCLDGFAVSTNNTFQNISVAQIDKIEPSHTLCKKIDSSLEVSASYDINAISSDSGVSVTSAYKSSQTPTERSHNFDKIYQHVSTVPVKSSTNSCDKKLDFNFGPQLNDLTSFESNTALNLKNANNIFKLTASLATNCLTCKRNTFCLHLKIPPPLLTFVEKDMLIVMLSHIVSPHEFYVNMAMENIVTLDELREHMTSTYESQRSSFQPIKMEELSENMFCAGHYDADDYWYRVKILRINLEDRSKGHALVQYVDYGNTATIKCSDLQPLTPEFSKHPTFAIRCSLAGVAPFNEPTSYNYSIYWDEDAVNVFKQLTSFERCLTAQICNELCSDDKETFYVLLWDTEESNDLLINLALANYEVAEFDSSLLKTMPFKQKIPKTCADIDILNNWDPMSEEYNGIENSYAVNDDDIQVATSGYRARDEEYTCKYFSLRGYCPRGENCPYEHLSLLESGVTRDQEEVYCLDTVPLITENTCNILVQVSSIINPGHFYAVLPFGCKTVDEIDSLVNRGSCYADIVNNEARGLFHALNKHYSNAPFQENTTVALSCGTIVAAKRKWDKHWHRGRIIDVSDISGPAKVFFVDSGDIEWVPRKFIQTILPQFLHTPFQAIHCSLHGIESTGTKWHSDAVSFFKDIIEGEVLLTEIVQRFGQVFHITLTRTSQNNHQNINQLLVSQGFALSQTVFLTKEKKESLYVPG